MAFAQDGSMLALGDESGVIDFYDASGKDFGTIRPVWGPGTTRPYTAGIDSLAFAALTRLLGIGSDTVALVQAVPDPQPEQVQESVKPQSNVAWSVDGRWIAAGTSDNTVRIWQSTGTVAGVLTGCDGVPKVLEWSADGHMIAAATNQHSVCVWHWQM